MTVARHERYLLSHGRRVNQPDSKSANKKLGSAQIQEKPHEHVGQNHKINDQRSAHELHVDTLGQ